MIKMERNCGSPKCDVMQKGKVIGHMEGVNVIQWFLKNRYRYTGTFGRFITKNPDDSHSGIVVDILIKDKNLVVKDAVVNWMRDPFKNGTFHADLVENYEPSSR